MDGARVTVMVVDDNPQNRALAVATLEDEGYRLVTAISGEDAVARAGSELPDCIVMDALPGGCDVAIVFLTAQRDVETFDRALSAGGDDFLTKPFRPGELVVRVQTALRLRRVANERSELFEQLKHQRDAVQRLELQKQQLVAFLVHDLKNPVHSVDLYAQAVLRTGNIERAHDAAKHIREETRSLVRMITNLLDISKADEGRLMPIRQAIDPAELVRGVVDELRVYAAAVHVRIESDIAIDKLHADPDLMARVLTNLVDNAIRHAPEDSEVRVGIVPAENGIELRVSDQGQGVPAEEGERVFERFRSGAETISRTNRGLGLAFCKLAIEAHGGRIWIENGAPGATFCVKLPVDA